MTNRWALAGAFLCACGGSSPSIADAPAAADARAADASTGADAGCATRWSVDATTGKDTAAGSCFAPFRTITHAMSVAASGDLVQVAPGTYDAAHGETFPLAIPAGVALLGDEAHKGAGATPTVIAGAAAPRTPTYFTTAITLADGATVAGFTIVNNDPIVTNYPIALWLYASNGVTLRNSTIQGNAYGVDVEAGAIDATITGNVIANHKYDGIIFIQAGTGSVISGNTITGNAIGVEYDSAGGDLGGGAAGSTGGNTIACNTQNDIWTNTAQISITAANNLWDHMPPTVTSSTGTTKDIYNGQIVPLDISGAALAASPCP